MKKLTAAWLCVLLLFSLAACGENTPTGKDDPIVGEATSYSAFMEVMAQTKGYGDEAAALELPVQSAYYYSAAGAGVSSLRYAVEVILWLKGEGDTLDAFTADSPYADWDAIAELNYSSPYPYYFEGLVLEVQGKQADDCYANAIITPLFPDEGLDFGYLKAMEVDALYTLRDELLALEGELYAVYRPRLTGYPRDWRSSSGAYLRAVSEEAVKGGDYSAALEAARLALRGDPFDAANWRNAAACALCAGEWAEMGAYLDEGLIVFPEDEQLLALRQAVRDAATEVTP